MNWLAVEVLIVHPLVFLVGRAVLVRDPVVTHVPHNINILVHLVKIACLHANICLGGFAKSMLKVVFVTDVQKRALLTFISHVRCRCFLTNVLILFNISTGVGCLNAVAEWHLLQLEGLLLLHDPGFKVLEVHMFNRSTS